VEIVLSDCISELSLCARYRYSGWINIRQIRSVTEYVHSWIGNVSLHVIRDEVSSIKRRNCETTRNDSLASTREVERSEAPFSSEEMSSAASPALCHWYRYRGPRDCRNLAPPRFLHELFLCRNVPFSGQSWKSGEFARKGKLKIANSVRLQKCNFLRRTEELYPQSPSL